jgi:pyrroloquinoline quinone biosynthesis protein E
MTFRPFLLLAELTYQCPLHCPYCSNPPTYPTGDELNTAEWIRVFQEAADLGVYHVGLSGGEPLTRRDLTELAGAARRAGLYSNLISSGIGLNPLRVAELRDAGLDSVQLSYQADEEALADRIAGTRAHEKKLEAARLVKKAGLALSLNVVLHRANIERLPGIIALAEKLDATRLELANTQYYGWGYLNRRQLIPSREQAQAALELALAAKERLAGQMEVLYVLPDYFEDRPKPCMNGWGRRYLTVNPIGDVLPCPTSSTIPGLQFDNVRKQSLRWIWEESESFNRFRGTEWMPKLCRECPQREMDFGGCRCQAALLTGDPNATDPVCGLTPARELVDRIIGEANPNGQGTGWVMRANPGAQPVRD